MGRKYKNPPIIEAVCEFRFEQGSPWDLTIPGLLYDQLKGDFPKRRTVKAFETSLGSEQEGVLRQEVVQTARSRFLREDEKAFIQLGPNFLAINHLQPYPTWDGFLPLIQNALLSYQKIANPKGVHRVGLRYVNRIDLGGNRVELEGYFDFYPFVGKGLPQDYGPFIVGIEIPFDDGIDILRLEMRLAVPDKSDVVPVILDLDYFLGRAGEVDLQNIDQWLRKAHSRVEHAFEGCLKDSLREQFQEVEA